MPAVLAFSTFSLLVGDMLGRPNKFHSPRKGRGSGAPCWRSVFETECSLGLLHVPHIQNGLRQVLQGLSFVLSQTR
jgi:hypothetical protein